MRTVAAVSSDKSGVPASLKGILPVLVALPVLLVADWLLRDSPFANYLLSIIGVNIILAVSLNIVNGMTGQFSIGHAGFMAVGAYLAGVTSLALKDVALSFLPVAVSDQVFLLVALLVGGIAAALCGFLVGLPSLRLRGDYLAIVTLGFGEIIRVVVQNTEFLGRSLGLSGIPQTSSVAMVGFFVFLVVLVARRIAGSSHGRSLWAIREDEVAAEAMGVNTTGYKVRAFVISSFFAGVAGGLFAHFVPIINPGSFTFVRSMEIVVMVVLGGLGSTTGAIVAAVFLSLLPEGLRSLFTAFGSEGSMAQKVDQIRMPVYGLMLVALMLSRPQGLFGTRELWDVVPRWLPRRRKGIQ
ncbi:branched-chain amino acid ABC transporter permease [Archangium sp.]|uniref:branched-chain amino acid ABC transporter permease n=1 Tax=Archangium sp. TaxID=1872627 RepID=UPI00286C0946|nr:branched-chain amino acid ABC transporter permease [Archangium sp.]